jgi:transcriptional regulator with XRE-family HTH domain
MSTFFERLREERERLTFSQEAFGAIGGIQRRAQINYEKGERLPDIGYLGAIAKVGADIQYITTGVRSSALSGDEALLLEGFRLMDSETKRRTLAMVYGGTPPAAKQIFNGPVGQSVKGNLTYEKEVKFEFNDKK